MVTMSLGKIVNFDQLDAKEQQLLEESSRARSFSYSPYSKFAVGAALLCNDGTVHTGCNVESASYPVTLCAERCALGKAVSEGKQGFQSISVIAKKIDGRFTTPCGMCRQMLSEFGDIKVYVTCPKMAQVLVTSSHELLPGAFQKSTNDNLVLGENTGA